MDKVTCKFYFKDAIQNRKILFDKAITCTKHGKVLYILPEELHELPQLSQDLNKVDRHYMKMITFLYASNLHSLIEGVATLPDWESVPATIILDDLSAYCNDNSFQKACGATALLLDTAYACSRTLKYTCRVFISAKQSGFSEQNCKTLEELYKISDEEHVQWIVKSLGLTIHCKRSSLESHIRQWTGLKYPSIQHLPDDVSFSLPVKNKQVYSDDSVSFPGTSLLLVTNISRLKTKFRGVMHLELLNSLEIFNKKKFFHSSIR